MEPTKCPKGLGKVLSTSFRQRMDPNYAAAYSGLADCAGSAGFWGFTSPAQGCGRAKSAACKSLEIDGACRGPRVQDGRFIHYDFDFLTAEHHFQRAIELNPGYERPRTNGMLIVSDTAMESSRRKFGAR